MTIQTKGFEFMNKFIAGANSTLQTALKALLEKEKINTMCMMCFFRGGLGENDG